MLIYVRLTFLLIQLTLISVLLTIYLFLILRVEKKLFKKKIKSRLNNQD